MVTPVCGEKSMRLRGLTPPRDVHMRDPAGACVAGPRALAVAQTLAAWREYARLAIARRRTTREEAASGHCEPPLSELDCIIASPLLGATRDCFEARPPASRLDTFSTHKAGPPRSSTRPVVSPSRPTGPLPLHDPISQFGRGVVRFDDELRLILMFALSGLAATLFLAAKIPAISDVLAGIAMTF
jgi:hypothetical protein